METTEYLETLEREGELLLAAAVKAGWETDVVTCPNWRVRDLVAHQGTIHRWACGFVTEGHTTYVPPQAEHVADDQLAAWFTEGHQQLLAALREAPERLECWTFLRGSPSPRAFWARRQAHETTVHRVDAERAADVELSPVDPAFAADGIDELLDGFHSRARSRVRCDRPRVLRVQVPEHEPWTLRLTQEPPEVSRGADRPADCTISGPAGVLYLALWNRWPDREGFRIEGDAALAEMWRTASAV